VSQPGRLNNNPFNVVLFRCARGEETGQVRWRTEPERSANWALQTHNRDRKVTDISFTCLGSDTNAGTNGETRPTNRKMRSNTQNSMKTLMSPPQCRMVEEGHSERPLALMGRTAKTSGHRRVVLCEPGIIKNKRRVRTHVALYGGR